MSRAVEIKSEFAVNQIKQVKKKGNYALNIKWYMLTTNDAKKHEIELDALLFNNRYQYGSKITRSADMKEY